MANTIRRRGVTWSAALLATTMLTGISAAHAQDAGGNQVEGIIVTAQKRAEDLQDVPVSIQAMGTEKLEALGVADFNDFAKFLPSVSFTQTSPGSSQVYMRGVASGGDGNHSGSLPSVGMYLDEQPVTTIQGSLDIHVYDIARVESLAGPQGTLYGASSQAGTIRIITNKPDFSGLYGSFDLQANTVADGDPGYVAEGFVNLPISDRAAARLVGWYEREGGYIDNVLGSRTFATSGATITNASRAEDNYNDVETYGARMALKIDLNDNWTVTPTLMGQDQRSNGIFGYDPNIGDLEVTHFYPEGSHDRWYQAALALEGKIGSFDLLYAGAYLKRDIDSRQDYSDYSYFYDTLYGYGAYWTDDFGNPLDNPSQYIIGKDGFTKESHELRISSPSDQRFRFVAGLFSQVQTHEIEQRYKIDGLDSALEVTGWDDTLWLTEQERVDRDYAIFGDASYDVNDRLTLTAGLRAFKSKNGLKGFFGFSAGYSGSTGEAKCFGPAVVGNGPCTNLNKETEEDGFTHRVNITYKIDEDRMVYGTWSTGYRPGGINRKGTLPPYDSDFLTNYELGWKTSWLNGSLRFNGAVYFEQWEDFQFSILGSNGLTEIKNAAQAEMYGVETDVIWRPTANLTLSGSAAYTDATLSENYCGYVDAKGNPVTNCASPLAPSGTDLPVTPKFKGNLTARYEFTLGEYEAFVQGSVMNQSGSWADLRLAERGYLGRQEGWTMVDFSTGVERGDWNAELFVVNATDERANYTRYAECAEAVCGGATYIVPAKPRTIGIKLGRRF